MTEFDSSSARDEAASEHDDGTIDEDAILLRRRTFLLSAVVLAGAAGEGCDRRSGVGRLNQGPCLTNGLPPRDAEPTVASTADASTQDASSPRPEVCLRVAPSNNLTRK